MSAESTTLNRLPAPAVDPQDPPSRWKLLSSTLRDQRRNLIIGSMIGLLWMVGKISVPILVRFSIDQGSLIRDRQRIVGQFHALLGSAPAKSLIIVTGFRGMRHVEKGTSFNPRGIDSEPLVVAGTISPGGDSLARLTQTTSSPSWTAGRTS